jgi:hypothetical protein
MATTVYAPGTQERNPDRQNQALQDHASKISAATDNITTLQSAVATLQAAGYVVGPASSTNGGFARFSGTTGKLLQDHAATIALGSEVSGNLQVTNLNSGTSAGATTFWRGDGAWTVPVLSLIKASLGADVGPVGTGSYSDGPSVAQGSTGTWLASGTVSLTSTAADAIDVKLWDGTTVIASTRVTVGGAGYSATASLSGYLASPAGNLRISCKNISASGTATIRFNASGSSKDSTISAFRVA